MPFNLKASNEQILSVYSETQSVWKTAKRLGMCGQSVHERLEKLGANRHVNVLTERDRAKLLVEYERHADAGTLHVLASEMGRTRHTICRYAGQLGLTDKNRGRSYLAESTRQQMRAWHATHDHPRGMAGKTHSQASKRAMSLSGLKRFAAMSAEERAAIAMKSMKVKWGRGTFISQRPQASWKAAWRVIGGQRCYFRSSWEANYARYLEWLRSRGEIAKWEHEPKIFWFERVRRGTRSYLPDFRVTENDGAIAYHEVKGWMDDRSKTKIKRMGLYFPDVTLIIIDKKAYTAITKKVGRLLPDFETAKAVIVKGDRATLPRGARLLLEVIEKSGSRCRGSAEGRRRLAELLDSTPAAVATNLGILVRAKMLERVAVGRYQIPGVELPEAIPSPLPLFRHLGRRRVAA